ncbi:hypothetical protein BD779DRAFT_1673263 [Infundibulicybe gibba]|nr:hypothetical protein BD779DRAFT_1673263 [Infundibulicybe gibba]
MPTLLSLPNDLIIKIADQLKKCKSFRGTCKRIDLIISPQVLSRLIIDISKESIDRSISQLEALASRSIRTAEYVRTIEIRHLDPTISHSYSNPPGAQAQMIQMQEPEALYRKIRELLPAALSTLAGTQTVILATSIRNPEWVSAIVYEFLVTLPDLRTLHFTGPARPETHTWVHPNWNISNITKLTLRGCLDNSISDIIGNSLGLTVQQGARRPPHTTPLLANPRLLLPTRPSDTATPAPAEVAGSLRHSMDKRPQEVITHPGRAGEVGQAGGAPNEEATTPVDDVVLDHLAALNGLRKLVVTETVSRINRSPLDTWTYLPTPSNAENEMLARKFFAYVLPRHSKTLVSLSISSVYGGPWFFGPNVESLIKCTQLTELYLTVDLSYPDVRKRSPDNVVENFLRIAAQFPNLYRFGFSEVRPWYKQRSLLDGCPRIMPGHLILSIKSFGPIDPDIHPTILEYRRMGYRPRRGSDGVVRYTRESLREVGLVSV